MKKSTPIDAILSNAVESIILGIEDYRANDPRRATSAARNYFSGVLLLAKAALMKAAPKADVATIISSNVKVIPNGRGGIKPVPVGRSTVEFSKIGERLADFGIAADIKLVSDLGRIRNDIEHGSNPHTEMAVREAIARSFPFVSQVIEYLGLSPVEILGESWVVMLDVQEMHQIAYEKCLKSFSKIVWQDDLLPQIDRRCSDCGSSLVLQIKPENSDHQAMDSECQRCGKQIQAEDLVEYSLGAYFEVEAYVAAKEGASPPLGVCPECGLTTYVNGYDLSACVWCNEKLGECAVCYTALNSENVSPDHSGLCAYHGNALDRD
ncbi:hypothetical protein ASG47_07845 [Devosia sp. Leaf420]|uniref:hypothetical protein n=1 Tax=Devosia sp. Leaf420 TaxID=1736374 RepID=UPI00071607C6|nr:hypothetical protein [Devosia sp. Leaf420]KQT48262.1 hypothetical protein ASG47_07845 [Devosia sp. Leaf420]